MYSCKNKKEKKMKLAATSEAMPLFGHTTLSVVSRNLLADLLFCDLFLSFISPFPIFILP